MRLFSSHAHPVVLYITLTSGSVSGSLFGKAGELLYTCTVPIPDDKTPLDALSVALSTFAAHFHRYPHSRAVQEIRVCLYALWFQSGVHKVQVTQDKPMVITESFLKALLEKEANTFLSESHISDEQVLIEKNIIHTKINGYNLISALGKKTKHLEATIFFSFMQKKVLDLLHTTIFEKHGLHGIPAYIHTFPLMATTVLQKKLERSQFTLFAVTDHFTEVVMVEDGIPAKSFDIPIGKQYILGTMGAQLGIHEDIASSLCTLYIDGILEEEAAREVEEAMLVLTKDMLVAFHRLYTAAMSQTVTMDIFILADKLGSFLWQKTLDDEEVAKNKEKVISVCHLPVPEIDCSTLEKMTFTMSSSFYTEHK